MSNNTAHPSVIVNCSPDYNDDDILCHCMSIKRSEVSSIVEADHENIELDTLISRSGVGSVCMGCHPLLEEMLGEPIWTNIKITAINNVSIDTRTYRFRSRGDPFEPAKAGQHIIVQAYIDGRWELRRYTLTTAAEETEYREITVQREKGGKVSNWFHGITKAESRIRISQPVGDITPDLMGTKPLICLVAGVGVTPAISFMRSIDNRFENSRQLIVDHSVLSEDRLICRQDLKDLANHNHKITINFRLSDTDGYINQSIIEKMINDYPNSDFFVCGPSTYSNQVLQYLKEAGVNEGSISLELFSSPEAKNVDQSKGYLYIGLALFSMFLLQDLFQIKLPWIEALQAQETYKIYSGLFIVVYMLSQFIMPYNKSCEKPHASAATYHQHKLRGAFAPLVFFIHSTQFGVAYLFLLTLTYFANYMLGLFNHERIKDPIKRIKYFKAWLPLHIALSVISMVMIAFHIYVVASY